MAIKLLNYIHYDLCDLSELIVYWDQCIILIISVIKRVINIKEDNVLYGYCLLMLTKIHCCVWPKIVWLLTKMTYSHEEIFVYTWARSHHRLIYQCSDCHWKC